MLRLVTGRVALGIFTLVAVSALLFLGTQALPGDVASAILGQQATPETLAALRAKLGLAEPGGLRYLHWLLGLLRGDLGNSLASGRSIAAELLPRLGNTLFLAAFATLISVPLSIGLGILAAIKEGSVIDKGVSIATLVCISMPEFFIGYVLVVVLAADLGWLPSLATVFPGMGLADRVEVTTLPAITLTLIVAAHMMRMTRASILSVMESPYVEMAVLKGLTRRQVVLRHALPNALGPIIAIVALDLAYLIVGVVVVEVVFVYPGIGQYMVDAVSRRDLPVVQACGIIFAATFVGLNTIADVLGILTNPRLRYRR